MSGPVGFARTSSSHARRSNSTTSSVGGDARLHARGRRGRPGERRKRCCCSPTRDAGTAASASTTPPGTAGRGARDQPVRSGLPYRPLVLGRARPPPRDAPDVPRRQDALRRAWLAEAAAARWLRRGLLCQPLARARPVDMGGRGAPPDPGREGRRADPGDDGRANRGGRRYVLRMRVESLDWVAGVLAGLGCAFTIRRPDELRASVAALAQRLSDAVRPHGYAACGRS